MRLAAAELVDSREILPGQWLQAYHAPASRPAPGPASSSTSGPGDYSGLVLRRPFSLNTADAATGHHHDPLPDHRPRHGVVHAAAPRRRVDMLGPLGRPFEVDPRSRHLLLVAGGLGMAGVRMLADEAIRDGRQVTLLFGAASAREVYPSSLLPDEVEYVVATDDGSLGHHGFVTELVPEYEALGRPGVRLRPDRRCSRPWPGWPSGRRERLGVAKLGRKRGAGKADPARLARGAAQGVPPGLDGAEHGLRGRARASAAWSWASTGTPQRVCREGPVFAAEELDWEGAWS